MAFLNFTKCKDCLALSSSKDSFSCDLGFRISFKLDKGLAISPKPEEKCLKPKTMDALIRAKAKLGK